MLDKANESDESFIQGQKSSHFHKSTIRVLLMNVKDGISLVNVISMLLVSFNSMLAFMFILFSSVYFL